LQHAGQIGKQKAQIAIALLKFGNMQFCLNECGQATKSLALKSLL